MSYDDEMNLEFKTAADASADHPVITKTWKDASAMQIE